METWICTKCKDELATFHYCINCDTNPFIRIKELEAERLAILGIIESAPELNPCNYTHDEAMTINIALIDIFRLLEGKQ